MTVPPRFDGVAHLREVFPNVPENVLEQTLAAHEFNMEQAAIAITAGLEEEVVLPSSPSPTTQSVVRSPWDDQRTFSTPSSYVASGASNASEEPASWFNFFWLPRPVSPAATAGSGTSGGKVHSIEGKPAKETTDANVYTPSSPSSQSLTTWLSGKPPTPDSPAHEAIAWAPLEEPPLESISSEQWSAPHTLTTPASSLPSTLAEPSAATVSSAITKTKDGPVGRVTAPSSSPDSARTPEPVMRRPCAAPASAAYPPPPGPPPPLGPPPSYPPPPGPPPPAHLLDSQAMQAFASSSSASSSDGSEVDAFEPSAFEHSVSFDVAMHGGAADASTNEDNAMGRQSGDKHRIGESVELPMLEVLPTGGGKAAPAPYGSSDGGKAIFDRTLATQSFGHVDATHYAASAAVPTLR